MKTWVKVCGCTTLDDVYLAHACGVDAVGFIFAPSPRQIDDARFASIAKRFPAGLDAVAVIGETSAVQVERIVGTLGGIALQFAGSAPPEAIRRLARRAIKVIHVDPDGSQDLAAEAAAYPHATLLFDTKTVGRLGGTGRTFGWEKIAPMTRNRRCIVAGGLRAENVGDCVRMLRPFGVDVRSGVERGEVKDEALMRAFVAAVRVADAS